MDNITGREMKVISYNKKNGGAQVVFLTTWADGKTTSKTKHLTRQQMHDPAGVQHAI